MFRVPRENAALSSDERLLPSTGRSPTPPGSSKSSRTDSLLHSTVSNCTPKVMMQTPTLGRQTSSRPLNSKTTAPKQSQTILNFFGKAEKTTNDKIERRPDAGLFFEDAGKHNIRDLSPGLENHSPKQATIDNSSEVDSSSVRFNEDVAVVKRRKINGSDGETLLVRTPSPEYQSSPILEDSLESTIQTPQIPQLPFKSPRRRGGFVDDSSDEEDCNPSEIQSAKSDFRSSLSKPYEPSDNTIETCFPSAQDEIPEITSTSMILPSDHESGTSDTPDHVIQGPPPAYNTSLPPLIREATSMFNPGDFGDEDFDDEFLEGEEYLERRWMEEQRDMETMMDDDSKSESGAESVRTPQDHSELFVEEDPESAAGIPICPICNGSMKGLSEHQVSSHVNACLDGNGSPLPTLVQNTQELPKPDQHPGLASAASISTDTAPSKRFQRAAVARPGQANPFSSGKDGKRGSSAFTRLMSGHAEDAAWAEAASNEVQSRGKPAYQRTCPFYKIMPGFYICVDAFRYGKVEGQNAYFLSHFHSDHYIGLTSSWCHGPIFASKVTCNLMRQQLRVESKWIHPLEFEKKVEVPHTRGVFVTMIPANHCPGSSLFLFEKVIGKNKDGSPRMTRILHCGDFRACPAHVNHPLLRPEVMDAISGQMRQQLIDTCYLDTTYLTPKYSFPSQYDVIDACAQMCISLSKEIVDGDDSWEQVKREKAGNAMTKFLEQGEKLNLQKDEDEDADQKPKIRGRLLVVIGTYSIGKERICLGIARALDSKIYAPPAKMRICRCLEDSELNAMLTSDPLEAQVHMQTLMEIRAETLHDYLQSYKGHFARVVGFRPTGWSYRPPTSRFTENPAVNTVLHSDGWKSRFTMRDLAPQRGSTRESNCFGVPYSEHSSFRELTMFCCALRINRIVPTVNVGSARSREKMKGWIEKWDVEKRKKGLFKIEAVAEGWGSGDGKLRYGV